MKQHGLPLFEAARSVGVPFVNEAYPQDKEIEVHGLKFHYLDWGNAGNEHLLLLHGSLQQAHSWDFVSLSLCSDYHVVALDARGHGDSQWATDGDYSLSAHVGDVDGFVEALGLGKFILVGHSMGGRNAYVFTSLHPDKVSALAIVDIGPDVVTSGQDRIQRFRELPDELDSYEEFAERIQEYTGRPLEQVMGALTYSVRRRPDGKWTWKYDRILRSPDYRPESLEPSALWRSLKSIRCPTLIVRGSKSDILSTDTLKKMLEVIPGSTSAVVPWAGHLVPGDNPAGFLSELRMFLDSPP